MDIKHRPQPQQQHLLVSHIASQEQLSSNFRSKGWICLWEVPTPPHHHSHRAFMCLSPPSFKIGLGFSPAIKYYNLLWRTEGGMWLISPHRADSLGPGRFAATGSGASRSAALGRLQNGGKEARQRLSMSSWGANTSTFFKLLWGTLAWLLLFIVNMTIRIMEILRNSHCGNCFLVDL